jgi:arylsulfatase A-like enzyme
MKSKLTFLVALTLGCAGGLLAAQTPVSRPNIIFIFSDDHGQQAISAYGSKVNKTPNLDRLADGGVRFLNSFCANSICTPSRATLLTGQYSHLNGVPVFNRFDGARDNVAKHLQAAGYHTGMIGKWHLGSDPTGFDRWIVLPGQGVYWNPEFLVAGRKLTIAGHCTDITTDLGIEWLKTRPKDKPFFLMLHHKAPHRAWEPAERHIAMFKDKVFPEPDTLWDDYATRPAALPANQQTVARDLTRRDLKLTPPADLSGPARQKWLDTKPMELDVDGKTLTGKDLVKWKYQRYLQDYLGCVQGVDDSVGTVLKYLDQTGLATNTIVMYSSDNGWYLGDLGLFDKRFMYEPGLHVPLLVRGPGVKAGIVPRSLSSILTWRPRSSTSSACPSRPPCKAARSSRSCAENRPPTGAPPFITGITTTRAITTPPPISASAPPRTSSSITGRKTPMRCSTSPRIRPSSATCFTTMARRRTQPSPRSWPN